jgi:hypothetical protein
MTFDKELRRQRDMELEEKLKEQREGAERQRHGVFAGGGAGAPMESDAAGYGRIQGNQTDVANRVMDKRVCQQLLHVRAKELQQQAAGMQRLAELISAAGDYDYQLFTALLTMLDRR